MAAADERLADEISRAPATCFTKIDPLSLNHSFFNVPPRERVSRAVFIQRKNRKRRKREMPWRWRTKRFYIKCCLTGLFTASKTLVCVRETSACRASRRLPLSVSSNAGNQSRESVTSNWKTEIVFNTISTEIEKRSVKCFFFFYTGCVMRFKCGTLIM